MPVIYIVLMGFLEGKKHNKEFFRFVFMVNIFSNKVKDGMNYTNRKVYVVVVRGQTHMLWRKKARCFYLGLVYTLKQILGYSVYVKFENMKYGIINLKFKVGIYWANQKLPPESRVKLNGHAIGKG